MIAKFLKIDLELQQKFYIFYYFSFGLKGVGVANLIFLTSLKSIYTEVLQFLKGSAFTFQLIPNKHLESFHNEKQNILHEF